MAENEQPVSDGSDVGHSSFIDREVDQYLAPAIYWGLVERDEKGLFKLVSDVHAFDEKIRKFRDRIRTVTNKIAGEDEPESADGE